MIKDVLLRNVFYQCRCNITTEIINNKNYRYNPYKMQLFPSSTDRRNVDRRVWTGGIDEGGGFDVDV